MPLRFEPRAQPSALMTWLSPVIALALTAVAAMIVFASAGLDPVQSLATFFLAPIADFYGFGELLIKAAPLVLIGIGLVGRLPRRHLEHRRRGPADPRGDLWRLRCPSIWPAGGIWVLPAMVIASAVGGMFWAAIPALLRVRFNANEILVSLMMNYIAQLWLSWLVFGPWRDPAGFNFPQSEPLAPSALFPILIEGTRANTSVVLRARRGWRLAGCS